MRRRSRRLIRRSGGLWGPAAFAAAAAVGARAQPGYSSVANHISGLAATGADSAPVMIPGFVAFGVAGLLLPVSDVTVRRTLRGAGLATVAAGLCRCSTVDCPMPFVDAEYRMADIGHAAASLAGFASWVALPVLTATRGGPSWYRAASRALVVPTAVTWAVAGNSTRTHSPRRGLAQRAFFATVFGWYVATSTRLLREQDSAPTARR